MKKFIITESEKNDIRKMYGLIKEQSVTLPTTVTDSYTATDCDELHAFQGTGGKVIGNMNVTVGNKLLEIYNSGVNPKVTSVKVEVQGMTVTWTVTIDKSNDGMAWVGFTSRGAGCNNDVKNRAESTASGNDMQTAKSKIESTYGEQGIEIEMVNDYFYNGGKNSFRQVFYRYTKPKSNPPKGGQPTNTQPNQQPNQQTGTISVTGDDLNSFRDNIKSATSGKTLDLSTIKLDMDNLTFSVKPGKTPIFVLALRWNMTNQKTCESCDNTVTKNQDYGAKSVNSGNFENNTRMYSLIVLYPKQ